MDLIIRNARLRTGELTDIGITDGKLSQIASSISSKDTEEIDAAGLLVTPPFIEPHIHLDKVNILDVVRPNVSGTLTEAIEIIWDKKKNYTVEDVVERSMKVIQKAIQNGTLHMRTYVDVDTIGGLRPLEGILALKEQVKHLIDLQIVAFPQEGIVKNHGCAELLWQAMEMGADIIGGMPANEASPTDSHYHVDLIFKIAKAFNVDVDMHVDETDDPFYRTLEMVADATIKNHWQGRVTAGHTCALAAYDDHYANYVMDKVKDAGMFMITNPVTNLMLQGRNDKQPIRRGITRVKELLSRDITMSFGQDCVRDTFYPFGSADMLQVALITAHAAQMSLPHEREKLFDMITSDAARILKLDDYGLVVGNSANLVIIDAKNIDEAISLQPERRYVIRSGKVIASSLRETFNVLDR
ncbi:MAG: amidohydrolase family protein [Clostridiales bacterium]|nr:amidohydrolase family protein [Clostridiales bacterium]